MALLETHGNWKFGSCEVCLRNSDQTIKMVKEKIDKTGPELFVCPQCGSTKRL